MKLSIYTSGPDGIGCVDIGTIRLDSNWTLIPTGELEALRQELEDHKLMLAAIALQHAEYLNAGN